MGSQKEGKSLCSSILGERGKRKGDISPKKKKKEGRRVGRRKWEKKLFLLPGKRKKKVNGRQRKVGRKEIFISRGGKEGRRTIVPPEKQ